MSRGQHFATCLHCLAKFICGDCIPIICRDCVDKGHRDSSPFDCPVCEQEREECRERYRQHLAAESKAKEEEEARKPMVAPRGFECDEAEFTAGILER